MNTKIVQKCGCYEDDCVEILGLEVPLYACFTCGYAGVTPSGADNPHEDEVHVHELLAEVKRLRETLTTLLNDCEMILDGDDMSGMSDQQLFGAMKSTILSGLEMIE